ncbi:unnamed protein product [Camellia sinensis]
MSPSSLSNSPSSHADSSTNNPSPSPSVASSSSSPSRYSDMWNYLWIPLLISFSKELSAAKAQSTILLPTGTGLEEPMMSPSCPAADPKLNFRPVIGIVSHPGDGASGRLSNATNASYIAASYVKFVEAAGARVIPLIYNEPPEILYNKLNLVNGVLFTGGWAKSGRYFDVIEGIFKKILEKNDAGDHFPLLAICLGFELLTMIISKDKNILESFKASDQASTLQFMNDINVEGTVFQRFPPNLLKKLSTDCLVMQNHQWIFAKYIVADLSELNSFMQQYGVSPERFGEYKELRSFFKVLTTSADSDNKVYVSTVHAHNYPVTAFQWHPEKNAFEWGLSMIPHSEDAVQVTQYVANFFVSEARKSLNRPPARKVLDNLIYNYSPTYCGKAGKGYDEVYIFAQPSAFCVYKIRYGIGTGKPDKTKGIVFQDAFILPLHDCTRKLFYHIIFGCSNDNKGISGILGLNRYVTFDKDIAFFLRVKKFHHNTVCVAEASPIPLKVGRYECQTNAAVPSKGLVLLEKGGCIIDSGSP